MNMKEKYINNKEDGVFVGQVFDMIKNLKHPNFSKFLTPHQRSLAREICIDFGVGFVFYGGYEDSERSVLCVYPDYLKPPFDFPIGAIRLTSINDKFYRELSHRDYLGSILGLSIERNMVGDIVVEKNGAYVFLLKPMDSFVLENLNSVARVKVVPKEFVGEVIIEREFEETTVNVASNRLDSVLSALYHLSRDEAKNLIQAGKVLINSLPMTFAAKELIQNDVVSFRGYGKFIFNEQVKVTKKGKLVLKLQLYV